MANSFSSPVTCLYIIFLCIMCNTFLVSFWGKTVIITQFSQTINGWHEMLLPACSAKHKVRSGVFNKWKESFMGSADLCIPVGPAHLMLWREDFDFGVIFRIVLLPSILNQLSVLHGISKVEWCTISVMAYTFAVLVKSHWFFQLVHNVSWVEKTVVSLFLPTCLHDGSDA